MGCVPDEDALSEVSALYYEIRRAVQGVSDHQLCDVVLTGATTRKVLEVEIEQ